MKKARRQGLIPWRVNEQTVRELEAEKSKIQKGIDDILSKYDGNEEAVKDYRNDSKKLHSLKQKLAEKQAEIAAEYKPEGMADVEAPLAPNGEKSKLSVDNWLTVRTKAFKEWFGDVLPHLSPATSKRLGAFNRTRLVPIYPQQR